MVSPFAGMDLMVLPVANLQITLVSPVSSPDLRLLQYLAHKPVILLTRELCLMLTSDCALSFTLTQRALWFL